MRSEGGSEKEKKGGGVEGVRKMGARVRGKEVASYTLPTKSLDTRLARRRLVCCIYQ